MIYNWYSKPYMRSLKEQIQLERRKVLQSEQGNSQNVKVREMRKKPTGDKKEQPANQRKTSIDSWKQNEKRCSRKKWAIVSIVANILNKVTENYI